jgi:hypothetical protein
MPIVAASASKTSIASQLRRLRGTTSNRTTASAVPPRERHTGRTRALVAAVVVTVSVEGCVVVPLNVTEAGASVHVGGSLAATGVMEQVRFTVPEKPFSPTTLIVALLPVAAPG